MPTRAMSNVETAAATAVRIWAENEDTTELPDLVDRAFAALGTGLGNGPGSGFGSSSGSGSWATQA